MTSYRAGVARQQGQEPEVNRQEIMRIHGKGGLSQTIAVNSEVCVEFHLES